MDLTATSKMSESFNLGDHHYDPSVRADYLRAQLKAFSLGEDEIRLGVCQAALRGCGFTDSQAIAEVFKQSSRLPIPGKTVKIDDFVQNFSGLANPLGNDPSSMLNTAPWMREPDHKEHIGFVELQAFIQSNAADSAIPKRPESIQKAPERSPRKLSIKREEEIVSRTLELEMASLKSKLALAVSNQDFVRAAQLKKEIDDQKSKQDVHETTVRQFPFAATLQASEREALRNEAIGTVKIDLTSATTLVLSSFREAMFRSDRGGHHALAKLRQVFKAMDTDASGSIDASELETGLLKFGITLTRHDLNMLFAACDTDGSGGISVDEFLASLSGEISTRRRRLITEAFKKLDRNGDGELRVNDLKKIFGEGRAAKLDFLLRTFDENSDGTVTEAEFLLYYSDLSASIKNDDAFEVMIRNAFHLSGGEGAAASTTSMRVMCFFDNGEKRFVTIEDDIGLDKSDHAALLAAVHKQGLQGVVRVDAFGTQ